MKIKKGDTVLIISGKDKGRTGKVLKSLLKEDRILVEGMNIKKKHIRPKKQGEKGQIVSVATPLNVSNVKFLCPKCGKVSKVGYKIEKGEKSRICKKCNSII